MLEGDYQSELEVLLERLHCDVTIPEEWGDYFFSETRVVAPIADDRRRFVRHRFRCRAVLEIAQTLPNIEREPGFHSVYTRDLSRQGVSFLHTRQIYPCEECQLWLPQRKINVKVVSCRRFNPKCYLVGGSLRI